MPSYLDLGVIGDRSRFGAAFDDARLHPRGAGDRLVGGGGGGGLLFLSPCAALPRALYPQGHHRPGGGGGGRVLRDADRRVAVHGAGSDAILDSKIGALDRTLGFVFGAARGFLLAVVAFAIFNWLVSDKQQPEWVKTPRRGRS